MNNIKKKYRGSIENIHVKTIRKKLAVMPFDLFTSWVYPDGYERQVNVHATGYAYYRGGHFITEYIWPDGSIG